MTLRRNALPLARGDQFVGDAVVAERQADLGLVDDRGQLARAQQRHGVDRDGAGLGDREPRPPPSRGCCRIE